MISLSDFFTIPPVRVAACVSEHRKGHRSGGIATCGPDADVEISCPPTRRSAVRQRGSPCPPTGRLACPSSDRPPATQWTKRPQEVPLEGGPVSICSPEPGRPGDSAQEASDAGARDQDPLDPPVARARSGWVPPHRHVPWSAGDRAGERGRDPPRRHRPHELSLATDMGPPRGWFRQPHGTTSLPRMGPPRQDMRRLWYAAPGVNGTGGAGWRFGRWQCPRYGRSCG